MNNQGDITQRLPGPGQWSEDEKNNIVDALGNPIYPDVLAISESAEAAGLSVQTVAIAEQVGGYVVGLKNKEGSYLWMQDDEKRPAGRMDNNGQIVKGEWDVITSPPLGEETVWMQKEDGGACGYIVSEKGGVVVAKYEPVTKTWTVDENAVASIPETPAPVIEVPFDKSNPKSIKAENGKEYQGYYMSDRYGTRLVDDVNNIILVKDGDTWREPKEKLYSDEYPAVYYETKESHADGFDIPITVGLSRNVNEGLGFVYSEAHMTQLGADDVASLFLHSAWGRYKDVMNHSGVTYEEYLELLKQGKGDLEILDTTAEKPVLLDPRQGFSLVITGDKKSDMPIHFYDAWAFNYESDETGRLLWASNSAYYYDSTMGPNWVGPVMEKNRWFMLNSIYSIVWISSLPDRCMEDIVQRVCTENDIVPEDYQTLGGSKLVKDYQDFSNNNSNDPLFTLR
jgi:hypothetical protein